MKWITLSSVGISTSFIVSNCSRMITYALQGVDATVDYLQQLGPEYIDLILEFSRWVLKADKAAGFAIFAADDYPDLKNLPQVCIRV